MMEMVEMVEPMTISAILFPLKLHPERNRNKNAGDIFFI